ncbi:hypothetical protein GOP47_0008884 [Adiantum capillus-veneris]|uniref:Uncharacterized protein n=1 Tax=Adiantum capillus-veneris TaxID=13818 RepID=A0A9D4UZF2_ADICA|nr:hypothetical protein GOP47_0008884 [Adiantum capillus-veneris]
MAAFELLLMQPPPPHRLSPLLLSPPSPGFSPPENQPCPCPPVQLRHPVACFSHPLLPSNLGLTPSLAANCWPSSLWQSLMQPPSCALSPCKPPSGGTASCTQGLRPLPYNPWRPPAHANHPCGGPFPA